MDINSKVLIIGRSVWDDSTGDVGTYSNLFHGANFDKTAFVYIESRKPKSILCRYFYQISEISLLKKLWKWNTRTGNIIDLREETVSFFSEEIIKQENATMNFVRRHRHSIFTWARELLWSLGGWKSRELEAFVSDFNPDRVFFFGCPLILMNKLASYIINKARVPSAVFLMDDAYFYDSTNKNPIYHIYRHYLRKSIREVVRKCQTVYVISPKMKVEYDKEFGIDSIFLTKGIDFTNVEFTPVHRRRPIKMVYMGQIIYGRIFSLLAMAKALNSLNNDGIIAELDIYTINPITEEQRQILESSRGVYIQAPVHANMVQTTISQYDVVVFVESFEKAYKDVARLSFSTKITDYLASGKCIFAIGPGDIAPIEYLKNEDAAIIATSLGEIESQIINLTTNGIIEKYSEKAFKCGQKNHNRERVDNVLYSKFLNIK